MKRKFFCKGGFARLVSVISVRNGGWMFRDCVLCAEETS